MLWKNLITEKITMGGTLANLLCFVRGSAESFLAQTIDSRTEAAMWRLEELLDF